MATKPAKWNGAFIRTDKVDGDAGLFGANRPSHTYLQFVTATVYANVTNEQSPYVHNLDTGVVSTSNIGTVFAIPHEGVENIKNESQILQERFRFKPLLRGITEIPTRGDQILVAHLGNVNYFLGPLNADNSPNSNTDTVGVTIVPPAHGNQHKPPSKAVIEDTNFDAIPVKRLVKKSIPGIDNTTEDKTFLVNPKTNEEYLSTQHGDLVLEGRHGNSIRMGSRGSDAMTYISNGRNVENNAESWMDSSIIAMSKRGTLEQLLGGHWVDIKSNLTEKLEFGEDEQQEFRFGLYSDIENLSNRKIIDTVRELHKEMYGDEELFQEQPEKYSRDYGAEHMYLGSQGRITLNSREDMVVSAGYDMHFGTRGFFTFSAGNDIIFNSTNIYLGKAAIKDKNPLVLGNELVGILKDMVKVIKGAASNFYFAALPLVDSSMVPLATAPGPGTLTDIEQRLESILSEFHYIENNTGEEKINTKADNV